MNPKNQCKSLLAAIVTLTLVACDDPQEEPSVTIDDSATVNILPTVVIPHDFTILAEEGIYIKAYANDEDGSVVKHLWQQTAGPTVELGNVEVPPDDDTLAFIAPIYNEDTDLTFTITVTDDSGASTTNEMTITVKSSPLIEQLTFADDHLKNCIISQAQMGSLTNAHQISSVTCQDTIVPGWVVTSLDGIEQLDALTYLDVSYNLITDLTPLSDMKRLRILKLSGNVEQGMDGPILNSGLKDISPLAGLTELIELRLDSNDIVDISSLSPLKKLEMFSISNNQQLTDISVLSNFHLLSDFSLSMMPGLTNLDGLSGLSNLTTLYIYGINVTDYTALSTLTGLNKLSIYETNIEDLTPLSALDQLKHLEMPFNDNISDITPLTTLPNLEFLDVTSGNLKNLDGIENITTLVKIRVPDNKITELPKLSQLPALEYANFARNELKSISHLENAVKLNFLDLSNNEIIDVSGLEGLVSLTKLKLQNNQIVDIDSISRLGSLRYLNVSHNRLVDISSLAQNIELRDLFADSNELTDVSALVTLSNAGFISLTNNYSMSCTSIEVLIEALGEWIVSAPQHCAVN